MSNTRYQWIVQHGPLHSGQFAERFKLTQRNATQGLRRLALAGKIECIWRVPHPTSSKHTYKLWQAKTDWVPRQRVKIQPKPQRDVTAEDLAWMKRQQAVAEEWHARKAAINEVRGRV